MATKQAKLGFEINMLLERETKGALRYAEVDEQGNQVEAADGAKIGTLYIRKTALQGAPKAITVSVTF